MHIIKVTGLVSMLFLAACASLGEGSVEQKRQNIESMRDQVLAELFSTKPDTEAQISAAPGYAVFSNANINLLIMSAGTGYGLVENQRSGDTTYMNMAEGGIGLGLGVKDYRVVMVFHTENAMRDFVQNGWTFGGNADAAIKSGDKGVSVAGETYYGNITVYTFTENGVALQATVKGTKFWVDPNLN